MLEQVRTVSVARVRSDLDKIVKRETDYAKRLLEEIVPVRFVWNKDVSFDQMMPFRIEVVDTMAGGARPVQRRAADADDADDEPVDKPIA
jgi:hypothetical protein